MIEQEGHLKDMDYADKGSLDSGSPQHPSENPWLNILPGDEAEAAYWNTL